MRCLVCGILVLCLPAVALFAGSSNAMQAASGPGDAVPATQQAAKDAETAPHSLKVVTYNIREGRYGLKRIAAYLREQNADLVFLQEVSRPKNDRRQGQAEMLARSIGDYQWADAETLKLKAEQYCDVAILSRLPLEDVVRHESPQGGRVFAISATISGVERPLRVMSVHATSTSKLDGAKMAKSMSRRFEEMAALLKYVREYEGDLLIGGDFNAAPWMPEYRSLSKGLTDLAPAAAQNQATFPSHRPSVRIDYVFARGPISTSSYVVGKQRQSDHLPIVASLVIGKQSPGATINRSTTQPVDSSDD